MNMKKYMALLLALLLVATSVIGCASSSTKQDESNNSGTNTSADGSDAADNQGGTVNADFSANVNVDRASDYAANEMPLPVEGIGRGISTDVTANDKYTIVVMTRNSTNPYMIGMWNGGAAAGEDMDIEVITVAPATQDSIEEQVSIMETYIEQGVDAFVIHPSDSKGIQSAVDLANENGIPVAAIGTCPDTGAFMRSGVDYYMTGYLVTKELCEAAGGKGGVIILEGPSGVQNMEERLAGIQDALAEYPEMTILASQTANCKRAEGMSVMENLLQGEGTAENLSVVATCNDEMAIGAVQALKAAGITDVFVGGADGNSDAAQSIKDGDLYCTYNTDPYGSTYLAIVYLVQYLNDGTLPEEYFVPFPSERHDPLLTSENIDTYISEQAWFE